jgi:hypothetical protein
VKLKKYLLVTNRSIPIIFIAAILICLAAYAYIGSFMRLSGDDYCYAAHLGQGSFWQAQVNSYLEVSTYNANRFSLTLFSGLAGLFHPVVNGVLPGIVIVLWLVGLVFALRMVFQSLRLQVPLWLCLLLALFIEFITLYQAPDIGQSLYWRSGMLPYMLPIVGNTYLFAILLRSWNKDSQPWSTVMGVFLLAFISGGFSEVGLFFQMSWLGLMWLVTRIVDHRTNAQASGKTMIFLVTMSATVLALVLLVLSPTNQIRRGLDSSTPGLLQFLEIVGLYTVKFFARSFRDQPLPTIYSVVVAALFGMVVLFPLGVRLKPATSLKRILLWVVIFGLSYFVLIAVSSVPFAYIQSAEPEPRAQIVARFVMTLSLAFSGIVIGLYLAAKAQKQRDLSARVIQLAVVLVLVAAAFYPVRAAWQVYQGAPKYQKWAYFWDMRDNDIRTARAQGLVDVQVIEIDHIINRVGDLAPDPGYWYNICAAAYYQVDSIRADLPGWDQ